MIVVLTVGGIVACFVAGASTSWRWGNAIATSALVAGFGALLWWLFASRRAGPIGLQPESIDRLKRTFWVK